MFGVQSVGIFLCEDSTHCLRQKRLKGQEAAHTQTSYTSVAWFSDTLTNLVLTTPLRFGTKWKRAFEVLVGLLLTSSQEHWKGKCD